MTTTAAILPSPELQCVDANGNPYAGGTIDYYIPGTSTRKTTWLNSTATTPNTNPVVLNSAGRAIVWGNGQYRCVLKDSLGNEIFDQVTSTAPAGQFRMLSEWGPAGNGSTDDATIIQTAMNACAGTLLWLDKPASSYYLGTDITMPAPPVTLLASAAVAFTGPGEFVGAVTNDAQIATGTYLYTAPPTYSGTIVISGTAYPTGNSTLTAEIMPPTTYGGQAVAGYFGAGTPSSGTFAGQIWGLNSVTTLNAGTTLTNAGAVGIGYELDLNNNNADGKGYGLLITGLGTHHPFVGINVTRADTTSDYDYGAIISAYQTAGLLIEGTTSAAPVNALVCRGQTTNLARFTPADNAHGTSPQIYGTNAGNTVVNWQITNQGGLVLGPNGWQIRQIQSTTPTLTFPPAIAANTTSDLTTTVTGCAQGDVAVGGPVLAVPSGFTWSMWVSAANTVTVRVANCTIAAADFNTIAGATWRITVFEA